MLGGKKFNFNKGYFDRLGAVLKLNDKQIVAVYHKLQRWLPDANELIDRSFLDFERKKTYKELIAARTQIFVPEPHRLA